MDDVTSYWEGLRPRRPRPTRASFLDELLSTRRPFYDLLRLFLLDPQGRRIGPVEVKGPPQNGRIAFEFRAITMVTIAGWAAYTEGIEEPIFEGPLPSRTLLLHDTLQGEIRVT
jgi:hypothetical protein